MSKFTVYILLIVAVFIGGAQEMMRKNGTSTNRTVEVTPKPMLSPLTGAQSLISSTPRENPPIPDSDSSKTSVAMASKTNISSVTNSETNSPQPETTKSDPVEKAGFNENLVQGDFSKSAAGAKGVDTKQPETNDSKVLSKNVTQTPDKSKIENDPQFPTTQSVTQANESQPVTTLKPIPILRDQRPAEEISGENLLTKDPYENQDSLLERLSNRTIAKKVAVDEPVPHTVLQPSRESDEAKKRDAERQLAEQRLNAQFLYKQKNNLNQDIMDPSERIQGGIEAVLEDVLKANDRQTRLASIRAYWNLVVAMIDYHWAFTEVMELRIVDAKPEVTDTVQRKLLQAAYDASLARFGETRATMIAAQFELQAVAGLRELPIAVDIPLVQKYNTYLKLHYPNQVPPRMVAIDKTLDLRRQTIVSRVYAELGANNSFNMAMDLYKQRSATFDPQYIVLAYEQLTKHRRALLATVRDYNYEIAEYVITVVGNRPAIDVANALRHRKNQSAVKQVNYDDSAPILAPEQRTFNDPNVRPATTFKNVADEDWGPRPHDELQSVMKKEGE